MGLFSTEKSDKPKFKKVKEEGCIVTLAIEIPRALADDETQNRLVRIQQRAKLPGFRPGKAPLEMVKKQFVGHAREEMIDTLARKFVPEALRELNINPVAAPALEDVSFEQEKPLKLQVRVEVPPQVSPKDYTKISVKRKTYPATDEAVDARLKELREANARLEKAPEEAVGANHYVVIDYQALRDGKPLPNAKGQGELVDMSSDQTVEGLVAGLTGMKREETKEIPTKLEDKPAVLQVTVKEIKSKILPELDADFAKDVGFETVDELKKKLREVIEDEGKAKTEREVSLQIEEALIKSNKIPVPPSLVEAQLEHILERVKRQLVGPRGELSEEQLQELRGKLRQRAEDEVRMSFLIPAIAEKEKLKAGDEDLKAELEKNLASVENDAKKEEIKKLFEERKEAISGMIRDRKTFAFLKEKASITEEKA